MPTAISNRILCSIISVIMLLLVSVAPVSAQTVERKGYFGSIVTVDGSNFTVQTSQEAMELFLIDETVVSISGKLGATAGDLKAGDRVAIMAFKYGGKIIARQVRVSPKTAEYQHRVGVVVGVEDGSVTLQDGVGNSEIIDVPAWMDKLEIGQFLTIVTKKGQAGQRDSVLATATVIQTRNRLVSLAEQRVGEVEDSSMLTEPQMKKAADDLNLVKSALDGVSQRHLNALERTRQRVYMSVLSTIQGAIEEAEKGRAVALRRVNAAISRNLALSRK